MPRSGLPKKYAKMGFKKGWREFKKTKRRRGASKGKSTRRRATRTKGVSRMSRKMKIPHPSITGLASGAIIALALDKGYTSSVGSWGHHSTDSVIANLAAGKITLATQRLLHNATELVATTGGRKQLGTAIVMATGGAIARKWANNPKLGGNSLFFRI